MAYESIRPEGYIPRIVDAQVERYMRIFGAVEIEGTKWCGKTWTARQHGESISYVDTELAMAQDDPSLMLRGARPHVIDEWQRVPAIWNLVRHAVDEQRSVRGAFLLTGSSTPNAYRENQGEASMLHSGAGRIGRVRMFPMTLSESGDSSGKVSLSALFDGPPQQDDSPSDTDTLIALACRGGWPEAVDLDPMDAQVIAREYLAAVCRESVPRHGLDPLAAERIIFSIARNLGQAVPYSTVLKDAEQEAESPLLTSRKVGEYLTFFSRVFLTMEIPGWEPPSRSRKRVQSKPKRYLADPSLAVAALGMSPESLMGDWQTFGTIFESLCMRDLSAYAGVCDLARPVPVRYYRDDSGLEVDAIVELADGRWAAFEIKVSDTKTPEAVANLKRLRKKLCENPKARIAPPAFMAVIVGIGKYVRVIEEGIYVIPITALNA